MKAMRYHILANHTNVATISLLENNSESILSPNKGLQNMLTITGIISWILFLSITLVVFINHSNHSGSFWKLVFAPLIGIAFAFTVFLDRSMALLAVFLYKGQLKKLAKQQKIKFIDKQEKELLVKNYSLKVRGVSDLLFYVISLMAL